MLWKKRMVEAIRDHGGKLPTPNEILDLSKLVPDMRTNVKIETFDALTGKLKDFEEGHNFLSVHGQFYLKHYQKLAINAQNPVNSMLYIDMDREDVNCGLWRYLYLTDCVLPESPITETDITGNLIGYADKLPYSGTLTTKGAINQNESYATDNISRFVFDFATDRANGIIGSVGLSRSMPFPGKYNPLIPTELIRSWVPVSKYLYNTYFHNGYVYGMEYNVKKLYRQDPTTGDTIVLTNLTELQHPETQLYVKDNFVYYGSAENKGRVCKVNMTDGTTTALMSNNSSYYVKSLASPDGVTLYVSYYSNTQVTKINLETGVATNWSGSADYLYSYNGDLCSMAVQNLSAPTPYSGSASIYGLYKIDTTTGVRASTPLVTSALAGINPKVIHDGTNCYIYEARSGHYNGSGSSTNVYGLVSAPFNVFPIRNMITRKLLAEPIVKNNNKTMKITYDIMFT